MRGSDEGIGRFLVRPGGSDQTLSSPRKALRQRVLRAVVADVTGRQPTTSICLRVSAHVVKDIGRPCARRGLPHTVGLSEYDIHQKEWWM